MEVLQETSSVSTQVVGGASDLITNRRSIEAVVQVDDGQIVALGGLITDDVVDTVTWVPFLGKLPIIGNLFRSKSKRAIKRNLMVFLKPQIIRTPSELETYSKAKYNEVRRDGQISSQQNPSFMIKNSSSPVLIEYDKSLNGGLLGSERQAKLARDGVPKPLKSKIKDIIFGRKKKAESEEEVPAVFKTEDVLEAIESEEGVTPDINGELE